MTKAELIRDDGQHNKYFHTLPNMYDDDLDPYEYRLIGHYKRVGISWEGTRLIAKITKMSIGKVTSTRNALQAKGLIAVEYLTRKDLRDRGLIEDKNPEDKTKIAVTTVIDVMMQNIARYSKPQITTRKGVHEVNTPHHHMNTPVHGVNNPVHEVNERITNEEEPPKKDAGDKRQRPVDHTFNLVALKSFGISDTSALNGNGGRIGKISGWLKKKNATEENLTAFYMWYSKETQDKSPPRDFDKFVEWYVRFEEYFKAKPARPAPIIKDTPPPPTDEERAALIAAVANVRPDWEAETA